MCLCFIRLTDRSETDSYFDKPRVTVHQNYSRTICVFQVVLDLYKPYDPGPGPDPGPVQVCGVYLWFLQDSWCTPPLWFSGQQHRWLQLDRDRADSQLTSRGWRRHRNRLYSAHSSNRPCCPDSHTLLDRQTDRQ